MTVFRRLYGDHVLHLLVLLAALALGAYTISVLGGVDQLFNPRVWWQSIAVWFAVAVIGHDLILFPLYALAERLLPKARRPADPRHDASGADRQLSPDAHPRNGVDVRHVPAGHRRAGRLHLYRGDRPHPGAVPRALATAGGGLLPGERGLLSGA